MLSGDCWGLREEKAGEEMKKILHMMPPEVSNGVFRYVFNHMPYMDRSKYEFSFLTRAAEDLVRAKEYEEYHFPVYPLNGVQRKGREEFIKEIQSVLSHGFDAVHLHTSSWRGFLIEEIAMKMGIPKVIVHSHSSGIDFIDAAKREEQIAEHEFFKEQFTMDYATDVCACSEPAADWLFPKGIKRDRIRILPNAVDVKRYHFNRNIRDKIRSGLGIEDRIVIGHVGRYSYTKNQEFLVRCFAKSRKRNRDLYLILMGQGENIASVQKLVDKLGMNENVRCFGWRDDIPDFLQAMDVFCLPSVFEGLPISAVEAQAAGLKCLISDHVTEEVKITDLVKFLPLEEERWVEELAVCKADADRSRQDEKLSEAGYDIRIGAKRLEELYE